MRMCDGVAVVTCVTTMCHTMCQSSGRVLLYWENFWFRLSRECACFKLGFTLLRNSSEIPCSFPFCSFLWIPVPFGRRNFERGN